ncbi:hypothetical protein QR680_018828 [Steinernema hermaphroditum]|uniref:Hepatocyte growth factor-regulated tyrosine kinase substrate helical domain-containing protein n=1 Tax=Steinernema hermaphroditum TaxID=289476 RepID=A0AA39LRL7_9BILA|nr:hypothetical protein QR680_018828 [Steinernema hermaphroditum]
MTDGCLQSETVPTAPSSDFPLKRVVHLPSGRPLRHTIMGLFSKKKKKQTELDEGTQLALAIALSAEANAANPGSSAARPEREDDELAKALWLSKQEAKKNAPKEETKTYEPPQDDDLARAIALSNMEAEKERAKRQILQRFNGPSQLSSVSTISGVSPSDSGLFTYGTTVEEVTADPDLHRYLTKDYWLEKDQQPKVGVAVTVATPTSEENWATRPQRKEENPIVVREAVMLCQELEERVDRMEIRIRRNLARGRSVRNDTEIHSMFTELMHAYNTQVVKRMSDLEEEREKYEQLQDRVSSIVEARQAVDALREDYAREKRERQLAEQRERQRQIQEKLTLMRVEKQEMLNKQRHEVLNKFYESRGLNPHHFAFVRPQQKNMHIPETLGKSNFKQQEPVVPSASLCSADSKETITTCHQEPPTQDLEETTKKEPKQNDNKNFDVDSLLIALD